ncbi:MAG: hypothetical protein H6994_12825 [Pseudomonadales bacterium]|nr:hypothetical protein [Pseudomonadales bacterium]
MADTLDPLDESRFSYQSRKDCTVHIAFHRKVVTTLKGREAERFLRRAEGAVPREQQMAKAKATGHFKHGNERQAKPKRGR